MVEVMRHFGLSRFYLAGHDRGGRVAHRLALDHPERVIRVSVMDVAPTLTMYRDTNQEFATGYVWWFFKIQPFPVPEHFLGLDPGFYLNYLMQTLCKTPGAITPEAMGEYLRCFSCSGTIHASCEDYRAAAGIGLELDKADDEAGKKVAAPLQALWGSAGTVGKMWDVLATWREKAADVSGKGLDCGHMLPEERPEQVLSELRRFFGR
jgi:haloacetate dehalogenase